VLAMTLSVAVLVFHSWSMEHFFAFCIDVKLENSTGAERLHVACEVLTSEGRRHVGQRRDIAGVPHPLPGSCRDGSLRLRQRPDFPSLRAVSPVSPGSHRTFHGVV